MVAEETWRIGKPDDPPAQVLGQITGVTVGPDGEVYVSDRQGSTVRAFGQDGAFLGVVGGQGDGPGEFFFPNDLTFDPQGRLFVRDVRRLTIMTRKKGSRYADTTLRIIPLGGVPSPWSARGRTDGVRYYYPNYVFRDGLRNRYYYATYDSAGIMRDTVEVPMLPTMRFLGRASYLLGPQGGRNLDGVSVAPFEPRASWDIGSNGTLYVAPGDKYEIVALGPKGDTLEVIRSATQPRAVSAAEAKDSTAAFRTRLDSIPVTLDRVRGMSDAARAAKLPDVVPEIMAVQVDPSGNLWVRRWPPENSRTTCYDVLDSSGRVLRAVRLPAVLEMDPPPYVSAEAVVGVVRDTLTDVQQVVRFRLPRL